jgi:hypothetical protein
VSPAGTRREALADLDRTNPPAERRVNAQVLELLGLVEPGTDLRRVAGDVSGEQVAGYYDTRRKRLAVVSGPGASSGVLSEITLAHELDHALDDQRLGLRDESSTGADDAVSAYSALVEGTATAVMDDYARRFIDPSKALGSAFAALGPSAKASESVPPYVQSSLLFSYLVGERFVNRLRSVAHGWKLVNYALTARPPASTEQVIHPDKYLVGERAVQVRFASRFRSLLPRWWKRRAAGTIGEFDTDQLLKLGVPDGAAGDAAAGWGGGRYEMWGPAGGADSCAAPCRSRAALVLGWAWDTAADAAEFDRALPSYVEKGVSGRRGSGLPHVWLAGDGFAAVRVRGLRSGLAFAPSAALAARLASGALER